MTIKIDGHLAKPLLGGARIANSGSKQYDRPKLDGDVVIDNHGNVELENFEKLSLKKLDMKTLAKPKNSQDSPTVKIELLRNRVGFTGLTNLGNTCFMNCILQALANVKKLRDYFLTDKFRIDLNGSNRLGTGGILAEKFFITLTHLWSQSSETYAPYELKRVVSKHAPQFMGFMQHDAQEFLAFFLDLLHEDVNRIIEKPLFETPNLDSFPDETIATELWKLHKSRNDSFIVDLFHGMLKSKLTCPQCHQHSTTFDPFVFLSVPIPRGETRLSALFCGTRVGPSQFEFLITGTETIAHLLSVASNKFDVPMDNLKVFNITSAYVTEELPRTMSLSFCKHANLVILESDYMSGDGQAKTKTIVILQREKSRDICENCCKTPTPNVKIKRCTSCKRVGYCSRECQGADWQKHKSICRERYVGVPFIIEVQDKPLKLDLFHELDRWLEFSMSVNGPDPNPVTPSSVLMTALEQQEAFILYKYSNSKELPISRKDKLDLCNTTRIVIEWGVNVIVCPKVKKSCGASGPTISDCLRLFTEPEVLAAEEAWHCPNCKENRKATKELSLWKLPEVLIIQLKRFSLQNRLWRQKVDDLVDFPIENLDLQPFCVNDQDTDPIYDLFAVVNHHGGLHGGHYTSYVTLSDGSDPGWRHCDDNNVTRVRCLDQLVTKSSYVMFYRRRAPSPAPDKENVPSTMKNIDPHSTSDNKIPILFDTMNTAGAKSSELPTSTASILTELEEDIACCSSQDDHQLLLSENAGLPYTDMDAVD